MFINLACSLLQILIAIIVGWILCVILTETNVFSSDPDHKEYKARTDTNGKSIERAHWFYFPYPGMITISKVYSQRFMGSWLSSGTKCVLTKHLLLPVGS